MKGIIIGNSVSDRTDMFHILSNRNLKTLIKTRRSITYESIFLSLLEKEFAINIYQSSFDDLKDMKSYHTSANVIFCVISEEDWKGDKNYIAEKLNIVIQRLERAVKHSTKKPIIIFGLFLLEFEDKVPVEIMDYVINFLQFDDHFGDSINSSKYLEIIREEQEMGLNKIKQELELFLVSNFPGAHSDLLKCYICWQIEDRKYRIHESFPICNKCDIDDFDLNKAKAMVSLFKN